MFSGVRDAVIQRGSVCRTTIRFLSRLYSHIQLPESPVTRGIMVMDQRVSETVTASFCQYPVIPLPSSMAATGGHLE